MGKPRNTEATFKSRLERVGKWSLFCSLCEVEMWPGTQPYDVDEWTAYTGLWHPKKGETVWVWDCLEVRQSTWVNKVLGFVPGNASIVAWMPLEAHPKQPYGRRP